MLWISLESCPSHQVPGWEGMLPGKNPKRQRMARVDPACGKDGLLSDLCVCSSCPAVLWLSRLGTVPWSALQDDVTALDP